MNRTLPSPVITQRRLLLAAGVRVRLETVFGHVRAQLISGITEDVIGVGYAHTPREAIWNAIRARFHL